MIRILINVSGGKRRASQKNRVDLRVLRVSDPPKSCQAPASMRGIVQRKCHPIIVQRFCHLIEVFSPRSVCMRSGRDWRDGSPGKGTRLWESRWARLSIERPRLLWVRVNAAATEFASRSEKPVCRSPHLRPAATQLRGGPRLSRQCRL